MGVVAVAATVMARAWSRPAAREAIPQAGHELLPAREPGLILPVEVERISVLAEVGLVAVRSVVVGLHGHLGACTQRLRPSRVEMAAAEVGVALDRAKER